MASPIRKIRRITTARLTNLIHAAYEQTGERVVILIDEYDAPMLDSINDPDLQDYIRNRIRNLFSPLKAQAQYLRFVFLTGISKFSQLSVFSELNNLQQLTFDQNYEAICGITEEELLTQMKPDIELLTEKMDKTYSRWGMHFTYDDIVAKLKETYDGYHFTKNFTDIYCPWSLVNAFAMGDIMNFWFSTGTPTMLVNVMRRHNISLQQIEHFQATLDRFDAPTERISDPIPVLFQSGYLTLKDYDPFNRKFTLGFPNGEVREGFANSLYKYYMADYVGSQDTSDNAFKRPAPEGEDLRGVHRGGAPLVCRHPLQHHRQEPERATLPVAHLRCPDGLWCRCECRGADQRRPHGHCPEAARRHLYHRTEIRQDGRGSH